MSDTTNPVYQKSLRDYHARASRRQRALEHYAQQVPPSLIAYEAEQHEGAHHRLIFTTATGLYAFDSHLGQCQRLLSGKFYGLTRCNDYWLAARSDCDGARNQWVNERLSDVCRFRLLDGKVADLQVVLYGIPGELHQLDVYNGLLYLPHTDYNQVLTVPVKKLLETTVPLGLPSCHSLEVPIPLPSHLNSIWVDDQNLHLIAHNFTMYSGRLSDWVHYHKPTQKWTIHPLQAHSAHNILVKGTQYYYCDSNHRRFCANGSAVFEAPKLLRGLSLSSQYWYLGGSDVTYDSYHRYSSTPSLYVLDRHQYAPVQTYHFPDLGDLYEIRQWDSPDGALSHPQMPFV